MSARAGEAVQFTTPGHAIVDSLEEPMKFAALAAVRANLLYYLLVPISVGRAKVAVAPVVINSFSLHDFLPFQTTANQGANARGLKPRSLKAFAWMVSRIRKESKDHHAST